MKCFVKEMRIAVIVTVLLVVVLCGVYPMVVFMLAQAIFPYRANGSIVYCKGVASGSALLGQSFKDAKYFHPRPSAAGKGYDAMSSGGSNLGPTSRMLAEQVGARVQQYRLENELQDNVPVPVDAVTASGSGLDPHISVQNAVLQVVRVAKARQVREEMLLTYLKNHIEGRTFGFLGEPRVNVLRLNLALDMDLAEK